MAKDSMMERQIKELVLGVGQYAYMQDLTAGTIKVYTGPAVINQSAQDRPVVYDPKSGWIVQDSLAAAVRKAPIAVEGYYLTLFNPAVLKENQAVTDAQPRDGMTGIKAPDLDIGKRVNIPGPANFPLWPGQHAKYVRGHHLRLNQYLKVTVYNEDQARKNWSKAIVVGAEGGEATAAVTQKSAPDNLTVGTVLLVKGTEASFYIPPTGIKVLEQTEQDFADSDSQDPYVRDALTLERLEYCILVDENGKKRYEKGPQVVFPEPTEKFVDSGRGQRKFRALELTPIQGIHLKVIAPYKENDVEYKEGDELFITGKELSIYYPREEQALIQYDGKAKHYATAIPAGEARYALVRETGEIKTVKGPAMYLPDPRTEVFVRRVLTDDQTALWYPGNSDALEYNRQLRSVMAQSPTTRAGVVSDGDYEKKVIRSQALASNPKAGPAAKQQAVLLGSNANVNASFSMESSVLGETARGPGDEFERASTYTEPRILTLNTRFQGVPTIEIWPGYAVLVVKKAGGRRVVQGPATVHLEYDESLESMELSTGKPKNTDKLYRTVYLQTAANKVADIVPVETSDHVVVNLKLSFKVNFTGDPAKWFNLSNYVKFMTDRIRSVLKGEVHKISIANFYANYTDITREIVLGAANEKGVRPGVLFEENGMHVDDVDVLDVTIMDQNIRSLLETQQRQTVQTNIDIVNAAAKLEATTRLEAINKETTSLELQALQRVTEAQLVQLAFNQKVQQESQTVAEANAAGQLKVATAEATVVDFRHHADLERRKAAAEQVELAARAVQQRELELLQAKTKATVDQYNAIQPGFSASLAALSENETATKIASAMSVQTMLGGASLADTVNKMFAGTTLEGIVQRIVAAKAIDAKSPRA